MKILAIGDFHGKFPVKLKKLAKSVDLIISPGDFLPWGLHKKFLRLGHEGLAKFIDSLSSSEYQKIINKDVEKGDKNIFKKLENLSKKVFFVVGNYDKSGLNDQYESKVFRGGSQNREKNLLKLILKKYSNLKNITYSSKKISNITFIGGFGHSSPGQVKSKAYKKSRKKLEQLFNKHKRNSIIFLVHNMPYNCKLDKIRDKNALSIVRGKHYGSKLTRRIIDKFQPAICVGGHFHENQGKCKIGKTLVVNPGPAYEGKCAIIDFDEKKGKVKSVKFVK